jgi:hypothetical protein
MQKDREEKIKNLISTSNILTLGEKSEWLILVDVMNDKQAGDLEKILESGKSHASAINGSAPQSQMPQLSHIVNLPNSPVAKPMPPSVPKLDPKKAAAFAAKLKNIVSEKELPEGEHEKSLPSAEKIQPKPSVPPQPIKPVPAARMPQADKFSAGLNFPQSPQGSQKDTLKSIKEHQAQAANLNSAAPAKSHPLQKIKLEDLGDLTLLTPQILSNSDLDQLAANIREVMEKYSYHEALFNIEKSELYKIYIATGLKLLQEQINFEELATRPRAEAYLDREEFEKFADLLRQIQSA